jgi:hypothetical protein
MSLADEKELNAMTSAQKRYSRAEQTSKPDAPTRIFIMDAAPLPGDVFVRPGRRTPRRSREALEYLKWMDQFGWTEDGVRIGPSLDDRLDEAYAEGVKAGLAAARRRQR